jgi:hypothetical protein
MTSRLRRRAAAVALTVSLPTGAGVLAVNTAFLATTADGGQPTMPYPFPTPGGPKVPVPTTVLPPGGVTE